MKDDTKQKKEDILKDDKDDKDDISEVQKLNQTVEELEGKYKRALADYQNLEKRMVEEKRGFIINANKDILLRLLPVLDTLIRANQHVQNDGLKVSIQQFLDTINFEGIQKIETLGKHFDPHTMEAIGVKDGEDEKVIEEVRTGYMLNEKVLRPAQVIVGAKHLKEESK